MCGFDITQALHTEKLLLLYGCIADDIPGIRDNSFFRTHGKEAEIWRLAI